MKHGCGESGPTSPSRCTVPAASESNQRRRRRSTVPAWNSNDAESIDFQPGSVTIQADDTDPEWTISTDDIGLEASFEAGAERDGLIVCINPIGDDEIVITATSSVDNPAITFERNTALDIEIEPYQR